MPKRPRLDVLTTPEIPVHLFGAGDVEQILEMERWRLQKFLTGTRYQLAPSGGQIGKGRQGSRRVFRIEDVYRIGIAGFLVRDGFAPNCVSSVLQWIEDKDLLSFDQHGRTVPPVVGFVRGNDEPKFKEISDSEAVSAAANSGVIYYALRLDQIIEGIVERVAKWREGGL
jgi:hypothetical protein